MDFVGVVELKVLWMLFQILLSGFNFGKFSSLLNLCLFSPLQFPLLQNGGYELGFCSVDLI